jgi:hypothetical protein
MSLTPRQLRQLQADVDRIYFNIFLEPPVNGDTGGGPGGWISSDSGILHPASVEAARLKNYVDAHGNAHRQDGRMRQAAIRLNSMGKGTSAVCDTGVGA